MDQTLWWTGNFAAQIRGLTQESTDREFYGLDSYCGKYWPPIHVLGSSNGRSATV